MAKKRGRPTILTKATTAKVVKALKAGMKNNDVADYAGISRAVFYEWLQKGETGEEPFASFLDNVKKARAGGVLELLEGVQKGKSGWQGRAWILERSRGYYKPVVVVDEAEANSSTADRVERWRKRAQDTGITPNEEGEE